MSDAAMAGRLKAIREASAKTQREFAERIHIKWRTWQEYEAGNRVPGGQALQAIAAAGFNVNWVLTGDGEMRLEEPPLVAMAHLDEDLHGLVVEGVMEVYKEANARLPPRELGRLSARIYTDVVAACEGDDEDPAARRAALRMALQQLRRDLQAPVTGDQSKRRA